MPLKSETCLWNLRHVSENRDTWCLWFQRQWSSVSLISEALKGREDEGEHLWFQRQWRGVIMSCTSCSHATCNMPCKPWFVTSCTYTMPCATCLMPCATCPMPCASCPVLYTMPSAPCSFLPCLMPHGLSTVQLRHSPHPFCLSRGEWGHSAQIMVYGHGHLVHGIWAW